MVHHGFAVSEQINIGAQDVKLAFTSSKNFWIGISFLVMMIFSCALTGPLTVNLNAGDSLVKTSWRMQGNIIISVPMAYYIYLVDSEQSFRRDVSLKMILRSSVASFLNVIWGTSLIIG
jgi:hypothetical protein